MSFTLLGILNAQAAGGGGAGAYDLLESTILTTSASSVEFTGLDAYSDYQHLQLRNLSSGVQAGFASFFLRLNGDSGNNYSFHRLVGNGSTVTSAGGASISTLSMGAVAGTSPTNAYAASIIDILDFANTSKYTTARSLTGVPGDAKDISLRSGVWQNLAAVTSLTITNSSGDLVTGSRFSLYGIRG